MRGFHTTDKGKTTYDYAPDGSGVIITEPTRKILAPFVGEACELNPDGSLGARIEMLVGSPKPPRSTEPAFRLKWWFGRIYGLC